MKNDKHIQNFHALSIGGLLNKLGSIETFLGGGVVAGMTSAQGASLIRMVSSLPLGETADEGVKADWKSVNEDADKIYQSLYAGIEEAAEAHKTLTEARSYSRTHVSDWPEKEKTRLCNAAISHAEIAVKIMEDSLIGIMLCDRLLGRSLRNLAQYYLNNTENERCYLDLNIAKEMFFAGIQAASWCVNFDKTGIKTENPDAEIELTSRAKRIEALSSRLIIEQEENMDEEINCLIESFSNDK